MKGQVRHQVIEILKLVYYCLVVSELQAQGSSSERKEATAVLKSLAIYILGVVAFVLLCSLGCIVYKRKLAGNRRGKTTVPVSCTL